MMDQGACSCFAIAGFLAGTLCFVSGCLAIDRDLNYSVALKNLGTKRIYVEKFALGRSPESIVGFGRVMPGGTAGWSTIQEQPRERFVLDWRDEDTGATNQTVVAIKLPPRFGAERGSTINIYLNSDTKDVRVTYQVFDAKSEDFIEVDSSGSPVKIKPGADSTK